MKLFIFEGSNEEPNVYRTIERLFFPPKDDDQRIICCYNSNIYSLYQHYVRYGEGADIVSVLREQMRNREDNPFTDDMLVSDFGEVYLFFDYDFHDSRLTIEKINERLNQMLSVFDDETDNGKLYISYPMIQALRYTKQLPDSNFIHYSVSRSQSHDFKDLAANFSYYKNWDFLVINERTKADKISFIKENWKLVRLQNIKKANWLCTEVEDIPISHEVISQSNIFKVQCEKYVNPSQSVSILSAFALFLYDYLGIN